MVVHVLLLLLVEAFLLDLQVKGLSDLIVAAFLIKPLLQLLALIILLLLNLILNHTLLELLLVLVALLHDSVGHLVHELGDLGLSLLPLKISLPFDLILLSSNLSHLHVLLISLLLLFNKLLLLVDFILLDDLEAVLSLPITLSLGAFLLSLDLNLELLHLLLLSSSLF